MSTKLEIVNAALIKLGQEPLAEPVGIEDANKKARMAKVLFPTCRDELLRKHSWNFAAKRITLGENLLRYSEEYTEDEAWTLTNATVTANAVRSPIGDKTASLLTATVGGGTLSQQAAIPDNTSDYSFSLYVRQGTSAVTSVTLELLGGSTEVEEVNEITWGETPLVTNGSIERAGGRWWRVEVHAMNNGTGNMLAKCSVSPSPDVAGTAHAWGAQLTRTDTAHLYTRTGNYASEAFVPIFGFSNALPLPCDFIRLIDPEDDRKHHRVEGGLLLCNAERMSIRYVSRELDTCKWDSLFTQAMISRLASELAIPLKGDVSAKSTHLSEYEGYLNEAIYGDSKENEQPNENVESYTWIAARHGAI